MTDWLYWYEKVHCFSFTRNFYLGNQEQTSNTSTTTAKSATSLSSLILHNSHSYNFWSYVPFKSPCSY